MNRDGVQVSIGVPNRRSFLVASGSALAGLGMGLPTHSLLAADPVVSAKGVQGGTAKSVILFFLCGGASHIDTWDMKPDAPSDYRGPFQPIATSAPGLRLCEHLPSLAKQAHHLAVINSVAGSVNTNDHHAGYYYQLTGHVPDPTFLSLGNDRRPYPDDWPYMGSVVAKNVPSRSSLPGALSLPHMPSKAPYTRPGQFAAKLGVEYDPLVVHGSLEEPLNFQAPSLVLSGNMTAQQMQARTELLGQLDAARKQHDQSVLQERWHRHQQRSIDLLLSSGTTQAFQVDREPQSIRDKYGKSVNAMSLLLARRLVEAKVPFITVFWKEDPGFAAQCKSEGAWDTHGNNFGCLKDRLLPEFDQAFSALLEDLQDRRLLDETLVMVTSEMGRKPKIGDPRSGGPGGAGRDHWTHSLSVLMAGGGIRGGQVYGATDRYAEYPAKDPVTPADVAKTVYHAMGIKNLQATDSQGRPFSILDTGSPILPLFG